MYRQARTVLREDLGIDPGSELQELHHRILTADSRALTKDMAGVRIAPEPAAAPLPGPRQLPADLRDFTGRDADISELARFLAAQENRPGAVPVAAIAGPGGIGKTALAVHVAHQVAARFTGGQLFVNLGGAVSPVGPPTSSPRSCVTSASPTLRSRPPKPNARPATAPSWRAGKPSSCSTARTARLR